MGDKPKTDLELASEALIELSPNVSASDRKAAPWSEVTIIKYLGGLGKELDTAVKILQFFRKRIEDRRRIITNEVQN